MIQESCFVDESNKLLLVDTIHSSECGRDLILYCAPVLAETGAQYNIIAF